MSLQETLLMSNGGDIAVGEVWEEEEEGKGGLIRGHFFRLSSLRC